MSVNRYEFIIGALSEKAGGVFFNNRVLVDNLLQRNIRVVFHNYSRENVRFRNGGLSLVSLPGFLREVIGKRPLAIWVHASELKRFYLYYLLLLLVSLFSGSRIRAVFHSGAIKINFTSRLPRTDIYLLDYHLYESLKSRSNVYCFKDQFVNELMLYLAREKESIPDMSDYVTEIVGTKTYILTTGYINSTYNFNEVIRAYVRDGKSGTSLVILSYGEIKRDQYADEFFRLAESPGIIHLRDVLRSDYVHLLSNCVGLVRATPRDSFGIVMYEANYFGVPVFASRIENYRPDFVRLFELGELREVGLSKIVSGSSTHISV